MSSGNKLDTRDYEIIKILKDDAKRSLRDIGREVRLSASSVRNRITRLQNMGIIRRFTVDIDYRLLGYEIQVLVLITCRPGKSEEIYRRLREYEEVHKVFWTSGPANVVCLVRVRNMSELSQFVTQQLESFDGVEAIESMFLMPDPK